MKISLVLLLLLAPFLPSCYSNYDTFECPELNSVLQTIKIEYQPDSIDITFNTLAEEFYLPKIEVLSITLIRPTFEFIDFKVLEHGHRFEDYQKLESVIHSELSTVVRFLVDNCSLGRAEEIMLTIGRIRDDGNTIPLFTVSYPLSKKD